MNILTKLSLWAALPLTILTISTRSLADATVPIAQIVSQLQSQTQVPILLPNTIPDMDRVYVSVDASSTSYYLSFDYTSDCQGTTACNFGGIAAERGGQITAPDDLGPRDSVVSVRLANGTQGLFTNFCGAYCTASVEWQSQGVRYSVYIKNGEQQDVVALANSAIAAGERSASSNGQSFAGEFSTPYGEAIDEHWLVAARLEEQGDFNSAQIRYQRALSVAQTLDNPLMRDCAVTGMQARIQAMEAARAYIRNHGSSARSIQAAHNVADSTFRRSIDRSNQGRPDLANSCP
jgi:hypothetical protein